MNECLSAISSLFSYGGGFAQPQSHPQTPHPIRRWGGPQKGGGAKVSGEPSSWGTNTGRAEGAKEGGRPPGSWPGEAGVRPQNQSRGNGSSWGPGEPDAATPRGRRERQPGHPSAPHKAAVKGPYACGAKPAAFLPPPPGSPRPLLKAAAARKPSQEVGWKTVSEPGSIHQASCLQAQP